jgi:PAS domain-containing protein
MSSEVEANRSILARPYVRYSFAVAGVAVAFLLRLVLERSFGNFSEFQQAQRALQASEERWPTTLQSIGDAVISTDANGNIDFMNDVARG